MNNTLFTLIKRNVKLFFKDKGMFFTSLITPVILLVLYLTFLGNIYKDTFVSAFAEYSAASGNPLNVSDRVINGLVGGELVSSILAVSCVTVAFCSNFLMVQDKVNGVIKDLTVSPVKAYVLSLSYYVANLITTLLVCFAACGIGFIYIASIGWYLTVGDVFLILLDIVLLVLFGNALSSIINIFLNSQGQISAVGTIISSGYGFICGAYMPLSSFSIGLQRVLSFLPGTYGTSLVRNHAMQGAFNELKAQGAPVELVESLKDSLDLNVKFFDTKVSQGAMYMILCITIVVLLAVYVLLNMRVAKSKTRS